MVHRKHPIVQKSDMPLDCDYLENSCNNIAATTKYHPEGRTTYLVIPTFEMSFKKYYEKNYYHCLVFYFMYFFL